MASSSAPASDRARGGDAWLTATGKAEASVRKPASPATNEDKQ